MQQVTAFLMRVALFTCFLFGIATIGAATLGAQCDPQQIEPPCDAMPPTVTITPASGTFGAPSKAITIEYSDNMSLSGPPAITLNGVNVTANFTYVPAGFRNATSTGTVTLTLGPNTLEASISDDFGNQGFGSASYTLNNGFTYIDGGFNNNDTQAVSKCEAGCFAATHAQSTVPYYSMGAPRAVTLVYNGDRAYPMPFVYVDVTGFTSDVPAIQEFWLEAKVNGAFRTFRNGDTKLRFSSSTEVRRLSGQIDVRDMATGMYPLDLIMTTRYVGGSSEEKVLPMKLMVVNENASSIARGWTIAGVQRLHDLSGNRSRILITEGDGSAVHYPTAGGGTPPAGEFARLTYNEQDSTYTRAYPDSTKITFDRVGLMTKVTDRLGNVVRLEYDGSARLWKIEDPYRTYNGGSTRSFITLVYGLNGLSRIEEPGADGTPSTGRVTTVTVDASRRLTAITDPDNVSTQFGYDSDLRLSTVTDRRGSTSQFVYDAQSWKLAQLVLPQVAIDAGGGTTQLASPTITLRPWQTVGVPSTSTVSTPATPLHPDSTSGRVTDAEGRVSNFRVDSWGQPVRITDPIGRVTTIVRNWDGLPTDITSPTGIVNRLGYSGPRVTSVQPVGQNPTYIRYGVASQPDSIYGPGQRWQRMYLEPATGRVDSVKVEQVDSLVRYTYDSRHRVIEMKDSKQHRWVYRYDTKTGNPDSTHSWPSNHFSVTRYDGFGRDTQSFAEGVLLGRVTYDVLNRPREMFEGTQVTPIVMTYDALFRTQVQDRKGQVYRYETNALGWLTREYDPTNASMSYRHDRSGLVTSWTNRRGQIVDYRYDAVARLVSKRGVSVATDSFAYSSDDRRLMASSAVSLDSLYLNTSGQPDSAVTWLGGKRYRRQYRWNGNGALDSVGVSTTSAIVFAQTRYVQPRGLLDTLRFNGQAIRYGYNAEFQRISTLFPVSTPGVTRSEYYTSLHQRYRTSFNGAAIDAALWRNYIFDERGRIRQEDRKNGSETKVRSFGFDDRNQLSSAELSTVATGTECPEPTGTEIVNDGTSCAQTANRTVNAKYGFLYDSAGNLREQKDSVSGVTTTGSHGTGNRISAWGSTTYGHDLDGNRTSKVSGGLTTTYGWSGDGLLTSVASGGTTLGYDYNALGQPVRRTRNGATDRYFLWDGDQLKAELTASSQRIAEYVYDVGIDNPVAIVTGSTGIAATRFFQEDELGNVSGVFGSGIVQALLYDARGRTEQITGTLGTRTGCVGKASYGKGISRSSTTLGIAGTIPNLEGF